MALGHEPHAANARKALSVFDAAGDDLDARFVSVAEALRVLLYEPADGHQGDYVHCGSVCCQTVLASAWK